MLILAVTCSVIIGSVTLRNYVIGKDFVPISANAGVTFAQGNNPWARGSMVILPGFSGELTNQRHEETQIAERVTGRRLKPSEVSKFWFKGSLNFIQEQPLEYLRLLRYKTATLFNSFELGGNYLLSLDKEVTPWLKLAFLPFGFIMAWAVVGLIPISLERRPALALLATFISSLLILLIFYVNSRYRMTMVPATIIMAGGGLDYLLRNPKRVGVTLIIAGIVFFISLPPFMPLNETHLSRSNSRAWAHLGAAYKSDNQLQKALWAYEKAISMDPNNYRHYMEKIILVGALDENKDKIVQWAEEAVKKIPSKYYRYLIIAEAFHSSGNYNKALEFIKKILNSNTEDYNLYLNSGILLGRMGKHLRAKKAFSKGLEFNPQDIDLQYNYAVACLMSGDNEEAIRWAKKILTNAPYFYKARRLLEQLES
jgi:tetratricopeptide (TPR) repeat protein